MEDTLYEIFRKYERGDITCTEFKNTVDDVLDNATKSILSFRKNEKALSFKKTAIEGFEYLENCEDTNEIYSLALLCDIVNNAGHSVGAIEKNSQLFNIFMGMKTTCMRKLEKICKEKEYTCYGLSKDEKNKDIFVIDVPSYGQIVWHTKGNITAKKYEYELGKKNEEITNMKYLKGKISKEEFEGLTNHEKDIIESFDEKELMEKVSTKERKNDFLEKLTSQVKTEDEIEQESKNGISEYTKENLNKSCLTENIK